MNFRSPPTLSVLVATAMVLILLAVGPFNSMFPLTVKLAPEFSVIEWTVEFVAFPKIRLLQTAVPLMVIVLATLPSPTLTLSVLLGMQPHEDPPVVVDQVPDVFQSAEPVFIA
jgi:hypothetical protein